MADPAAPAVLAVPNVSEGRRVPLLQAMARDIAAAGAQLLDASRDPAHHRAVFTFAGAARQVQAAVIALADRAVREIDLRTHAGVHPRMGALDVVPFVPIGGTTMAQCVGLARDVGRELADRLAVPVYLYEFAASRPDRRRLEDVRRGGFEGLAAKMRLSEWAPDFGPAAPHPTAGATAVGARRPLVAFNVTLETDRLEVAHAVARAVRERTGGLPGVKALGVPLADRGCVQVSMNLTNLDATSPQPAFEQVQREASRFGVSVRASEIVGLVPAAALPPDPERTMRLERFDRGRILETRLAAPPFDPDSLI